MGARAAPLCRAVPSFCPAAHGSETLLLYVIYGGGARLSIVTDCITVAAGVRSVDTAKPKSKKVWEERPTFGLAIDGLTIDG